jgi:hypothetical protein
MKTIYQLVSQSILFCILIIGCKTSSTSRETDKFALFTSKEVFDSISESIITVPSIDRYISIPSILSLDKKLNCLLDSISKNNFNNLKIQSLGIEEIQKGYKSLKVNLVENSGFKIPDSLGKYQSWYDFFQGSAGGQATTIILTESILQREYKGDWINEVEFYYQNEKMGEGEWDHISLSGIIKR